MNTLTLANRYAVMQRIDGEPRNIGVVTANNLSHANSKALKLFSRHVWVERRL
jgi:hypothetical protein